MKNFVYVEDVSIVSIIPEKSNDHDFMNYPFDDDDIDDDEDWYGRDVSHAMHLNGKIHSVGLVDEKPYAIGENTELEYNSKFNELCVTFRQSEDHASNEQCPHQKLENMISAITENKYLCIDLDEGKVVTELSKNQLRELKLKGLGQC